MTNLLRRLRKLKADLIDTSGLLPHSKARVGYWKGRVDQLLAGEDAGPQRISLAAFDSIDANGTGGNDEDVMPAVAGA